MRQQLITLCPECRTHFDISQEQLQAADGRVRCGSCQHVFVATEHLQTRAETTERDQIPSEALLLSVRRQGNGWAPLLWGLLILLALAGMGLQLLWFERDRLSQQPLLEPVYAELCQRLDCRLSPRQELPSIRSQHLLLRQHPDFVNALTLDLTFINQAPFEQPFPALQLIFTGLDDSLRAARTFQPHEYLRGDLLETDLMPHRSPIQIHLELLDPGTLAPNYQLQFVPAKAPPLNTK